MDYDRISRDFLRAVRGTRRQVDWSRDLGYQSNVAAAWESGRNWPSAATAFRAARLAGYDPALAVERFYAARPPWLAEVDLATPEGAARLIDDLRGHLTVTDLARRAELPRVSLSRWLGARAEPRLPDYLRVVQAASLRLVDLLEAFVPPAGLPSVARLWERLEARRTGAFAHPWTQAILRGLELAEYQALRRHEVGWLTRRLGLPANVEATCIEFLRQTRQIGWNGRRWAPSRIAVDTRRHPEMGRHLKVHWTQAAVARLDDADGVFSNLVFGVSRRDFERIRALHLKYYRAVRALVAESEPGEVVAVVNVQLFPLEG